MSGPIQISRRILLINSVSSALRKVLMLSVMVWLYQYLIGKIPAEEYSLYPVLMAMMAFLPLATTLFLAGLRRFVTEAYASGDNARVKQLVSSMLRPLSILAVVVLVGGLLLARNIERVLTIAPEQVETARLMFALLIGMAALRVLLAPLTLGFHLRQRFLARNVLGLLMELLRIGILLPLVLHDPRVLWVVVASIGSGVVELAVTVAWSLRMVPALRPSLRVYRPELVRPLFTFGGWSVLTQIGLLIRDASDPLILNEAATPTDVVAFQVGSMPDTQTRRVYLEAYSTAQPMVMAMEATGQRDRLRRTYFRLCRYSMWIMLALAIPLIVTRVELYRLYLEEKATEYAAAATVMALLLARGFVIFPNSILGMLSSAKNRVRDTALRACAISLANLALTLYLVGVRGMGAIGSALSTAVVTFLFAPTLMWPLGLDFTGAKFLPWARASIVPGVVPTLVAGPVWYALNRTLEPDTWGELGAVVLGGALVYLAAMLGVAFRPEDRADLGRAFARLRGRRGL